MVTESLKHKILFAKQFLSSLNKLLERPKTDQWLPRDCAEGERGVAATGMGHLLGGRSFR